MTTTRGYQFTEATDDQKKQVGRIIKEARLRRDLSPEDAAKQAGVTRSTFYRWERGDIASATVLVIHWLIGANGNQDALYWRQRAMMAEDTLLGINTKLTEFARTRQKINELGL